MLFSLSLFSLLPPLFDFSLLTKIVFSRARSARLSGKGVEVSDMLNTYSSIWDSRDHLKSSKHSLDPSQLKRLNSSLYRSAYHKLRKMDPALIMDILLPLYSHTGRPAIDPTILLRSFILMLHLGYTSIHRWCDDLKADSLLQYLVGTSSPPSMASHYDFIIRLTRNDPHLSTLYLKDHYKKPDKKKLKKS